MNIIIEGPAGAGKTVLMSRLVRKRWKKGENIYPNFPMWFDEEHSRIFRWHNLDETYHLTNGILCIDESQKFMDARRWASLPLAFTEKIAMHRHHHLDLYSTTQDFGHIDIRMRSNVHERFRCGSVLRFPKHQKYKPIFQVIMYKRYTRAFDSENQHVKWSQFGFVHFMFISRFWTKTYFNTYGDVGKQNFICKINYQRKALSKLGSYKIRMVSRELLEKGKARM